MDGFESQFDQPVHRGSAVRFGPNEGTDWPERPTATSTPQQQEPDWDPDTDMAWTREIDGVFDDSDSPGLRMP